MSPANAPARPRARASRGPAVLAALINGASLDQIAEAENIKPKQLERLLRSELRKRWIAPLQDYARLQIARLESIASQLKGKSNNADLPTIDRLLKVMDRLDRYHGFTKLAPLATASDEDSSAKLIVRMEQAASKLARAK